MVVIQPVGEKEECLILPVVYLGNEDRPAEDRVERLIPAPYAGVDARIHARVLLSLTLARRIESRNLKSDGARLDV